MKKIYVIGAGGVGSWLAPSLCLLRSPGEVTLIDGDTLERKNLNRQLFEERDIGASKAARLAEKYRCSAIPVYYSFGGMEHGSSDWLFCCADNNPARLAVLHACDTFGCQAIIAANETTSSEAYYYRRAWKGTPLDPRVYYPELSTNHSGDPLARAIGCTGEAQERNRQLVSANFSAAALAQNLFVLWGIKAQTLSRDVVPSLPFKLVSNLSRLETFRIKDHQQQNERTEP